jgi:hypothetical protein
MILTTFEEQELKKAEKIWVLLLCSFVLDSLVGASIDFKVPYLSLAATAMLALTLLFNSKELLAKLAYSLTIIQHKSRGQRSIYSMIFYFLFALLIVIEIFSKFGFLIYENIFYVVFPLALGFFSIRAAIKEKKRHDILMKSNPNYFSRHQMLQNLIILLLPAVLARMAAVIAAIQVNQTDNFAIELAQYCLALFLFIQSYPVSDLVRPAADKLSRGQI